MSSGESVRYWRHQGLGGLDLMRARFVGHRFSRHSHETFAIGVVESGTEEIRFADGVEYTGVDEVVLIDPGVVHTGRAHSPGGWTYRVLYPSVEQLAAIGAEIGAPAGQPSFSRRVVADGRMAGRVVAAHRAAETGDPLAADSCCTCCWPGSWPPTAGDARSGSSGRPGRTSPVPARARAAEVGRKPALDLASAGVAEGSG